MRQQTITVMDEYVPVGTTYTSAQFNSILASGDQLALQAIVDNGGGSGTLDIFAETSSDGRNWIQRNDQSTTAATTTGDIHFAFTGTGFQQLMWADGGQGNVFAVATHTGPGGATASGSPFLGFVRLRVTAASFGVHVKIHATVRGPR